MFILEKRGLSPIILEGKRGRPLGWRKDNNGSAV